MKGAWGCILAGSCDTCCSGKIGNVSGLTKVQTIVVLNDVDAEEGFEIVGLSDCVFFLESRTEVFNERWVGCCNCEVVYVDAEIFLAAIGIKAIEEAGVMCGPVVLLS